MAERLPKVVLVTGASSGIGAAIALEAARKGHRLVLTARREFRLKDVAERARKLGAEVATVQADLGSPDSPARVVSESVDRFGGIDVVINNAGLGLPHVYGESDPEALRRQIDINFVAPILLTRHALPHLIQRRGMVINVGSSITCVANPIFGVYGATKAGIAYWNDALRRELHDLGVRVCLVEPGPVATEFFDAIEATSRNGAGREEEDAERIVRLEHEQGEALVHLDFDRAEDLRGEIARIQEEAADRDVGRAARKNGTGTSSVERPPAFVTADVEDVARRIVRLIDHPRRRISVLRRIVWPFRLAGVLFQAAPWLGDVALAGMIRRMREPRKDIPAKIDARRLDDVQAPL